jgi:predicted AAA+ superfamily ATPase
MNKDSKLYVCINMLLSSIERLLPIEQPVTNWKTAIALRWRKRGDVRFIQSDK